MVRRQLSLFVPGKASAQLESLRKVLDPVQQRLIPAHVTLAREDELVALDHALTQERLRTAKPITLRFGEAESFAGHGIVLNCIAGEPEFQELRRLLLGGGVGRQQRPHITLAHPRNPRAPGNSMANAATLPGGLVITFTSACLIEQVEEGPWKVLQTYELLG